MTFADDSVVDLVLSEVHRIDGRLVEVKLAVSREESRSKLLASGSQSDRRKLFVGGLSPSVTSAEFREHFERFGTVVDAVVMIDRDTNRCVAASHSCGKRLRVGSGAQHTERACVDRAGRSAC